jgi:hypothetical protein
MKDKLVLLGLNEALVETPEAIKKLLEYTLNRRLLSPRELNNYLESYHDPHILIEGLREFINDAGDFDKTQLELLGKISMILGNALEKDALTMVESKSIIDLLLKAINASNINCNKVEGMIEKCIFESVSIVKVMMTTLTIFFLVNYPYSQTGSESIEDHL